MIPSWGSLPFTDLDDVVTAVYQYLAGPYVAIDGPGLFRTTMHFADTQGGPFKSLPENPTSDPVPRPRVGESFHTYLDRVTGGNFDNTAFQSAFQGGAQDLIGWAVKNVNNYFGTSISANVKAAASGQDFTATWPNPSQPVIKLGVLNRPVTVAGNVAAAAPKSSGSSSSSSGATVAIVAGGALALFFILRR